MGADPGAKTPDLLSDAADNIPLRRTPGCGGKERDPGADINASVSSIDAGNLLNASSQQQQPSSSNMYRERGTSAKEPLLSNPEDIERYFDNVNEAQLDLLSASSLSSDSDDDHDDEDDERTAALMRGRKGRIRGRARRFFSSRKRRLWLIVGVIVVTGLVAGLVGWLTTRDRPGKGKQVGIDVSFDINFSLHTFPVSAFT